MTGSSIGSPRRLRQTPVTFTNLAQTTWEPIKNKSIAKIALKPPQNFFQTHVGEGSDGGRDGGSRRPGDGRSPLSVGRRQISDGRQDDQQDADVAHGSTGEYGGAGRLITQQISSLLVSTSFRFTQFQISLSLFFSSNYSAVSTSSKLGGRQVMVRVGLRLSSVAAAAPPARLSVVPFRQMLYGQQLQSPIRITPGLISPPFFIYPIDGYASAMFAAYKKKEKKKVYR
jgi:hypothetical protein